MNDGGVRPSFPVVCLLLPAEGMEGLEAFFRSVPSDPGAAFFLVRPSSLGARGVLEGLQRFASLPAREAAAGELLEPNRILVATPGLILDAKGGAPMLAESLDVLPEAGAWNRILLSLQRIMGEALFASALPGCAPEGMTALRNLQDQGAQVYLPEGASGLPRSAGEMAEQILEDLRNELPLGAARAGILEQICAVLARRTDNDFSRYKRGTLQRRIGHRMKVNGCRSLQEYLVFLEEEPEEARALLDDLLIGVTEFFRDPEAFESLNGLLRGILASSGPEAPLRIWVPGCCTGEEAYSIAILVRENLDALGSARRVQIFATDIDTSALLHAKAGHYASDAMLNVSPSRQERFFIHDGTHFRVTKELREMCLFSVQNIIRDPPFSALHLISCRNVFIYLQPELQRRMLPIFHFALQPQGLLFLGAAEGVGLQPDCFEPLEKVSRIFRRREVPGGMSLMLPQGRSRLAYGSGSLTQRPAANLSSGALTDGLFERMLLEDYVPASALVNEGGDVLFCAGRIGRFLHPPMGVPSHNLLQSTGGSLRRSLRNLLAQVARDPGAGPRHALVSHEGESGAEELQVTVRPMPGLDREAGVFAVILQTRTNVPPVLGGRAAEEGEGRLLDQMEMELRATQSELQATQEELGSTNEEFRASNEELQAANEELQASQEELQSVNEELTSLNLELQHTIAELRGANSDLQNTLAATSIAMLFLDADLRITRFTPAITALFRLIDGDLGRPIGDILPLFEGADLLAMARNVLAAHEVREAQVRNLEGDRWFVARVSPYRTLAQGVSGVVVTFTDLTEIMVAVHARRESEEARRISDARLDQAMERSHIGVWGFNPAEGTGFRTLEHARIFGYESETSPWSLELFLEHVVHEDRPAVEDRIRDGLHSRRDWSVQCRIRRVDGEIRWIQAAGGIRGGDGPGWMSGIVQDITTQKQAEEEVRFSEERFAMAFHGSPDGIAITRLSDGVYRMVNEGFTRIFGWSPDQVVGRSSVDLGVWINTGDRARWRDELELKGEITCLELPFRKADGSLVICQVSSRPMSLAGEGVQLSIIRDVTGLKQEEQERRLLESEVEHMQRLESLGRLAGGVAHDMNNVLGAIYAVTQALRSRQDESSELAEALATVERAASRGRDLVKGLVGFSRKGLGEPVSIDLNTLVRQEVALLDRTLMQRYQLVVDLEEGLPPVLGETGPLGSALMNLCVNAVDAMPAGGVLTLRTRRSGDHVQVSVEDTGEGMPPEVARRAMEPFFTTKPFGKGTGLGLATVMNTARAHKGTLILESEPGQGTRAILSLPAALACAQVEPPAGPAEGLPVRLNILLVDDDELLRASVPPMLRLLGHFVDAVDSGPAAIACLEAGVCPDLVILDVNMPGMGGLETLQRLRLRHPVLPVLLATGYLDAEVEAASKDDAWVLTLAKPFTISEIQRKFTELAERLDPPGDGRRLEAPQ